MLIFLLSQQSRNRQVSPGSFVHLEDAILTRLAGVFREVFPDKSVSLSRDTRASDVKGWDSLTHIKLMLSVQRAFRVRLSALESSQLHNVGALVDLLRSKLER